jgi:hypothetical protein
VCYSVVALKSIEVCLEELQRLFGEGVSAPSLSSDHAAPFVRLCSLRLLDAKPHPIFIEQIKHEQRSPRTVDATVCESSSLRVCGLPPTWLGAAKCLDSEPHEQLTYFLCRFHNPEG